MKFRVEIATILPCVFIAMLMFTVSCTREPTLDVDKWRAVNDSTLTPAQRRQSLEELMAQRQFIRSRLSSAVNLLGQPDYVTSDSAVYTIFESRRSNDSLITMRLIFKLTDDSIIKSTVQLTDVKIVQPDH